MSELQCAESEKDLADIRLELISSGYDRKAKTVKKERLRPQQPLRFVTDDGLEVLVRRKEYPERRADDEACPPHGLLVAYAESARTMSSCAVTGLSRRGGASSRRPASRPYYSQGATPASRRWITPWCASWQALRLVAGQGDHTDYRTIIIEGDESLVERLRVKKIATWPRPVMCNLTN